MQIVNLPRFLAVMCSLGVAFALGCAEYEAPPPGPTVATAPTPEAPKAPGADGVAEKVYYGTRSPSHLPLTPGQEMAVGTFGGCSGTLISPTWLLSASHCGLTRSARFCMGPEPANPAHCVGVKRAIDNPRADMTILELDQDARNVLPSVEPIPLLTESLDNAWIGRTAEASGYGRNEQGGYGRRAFTAQPIASLGSRTLTIDGEGRRGVCFGDSGGPVMVIASDGSARVAGDLSNGDSSCVGRDNYTRVDVYLDWIEGYTGETIPPGPQPCEAVDAEGLCDGNGRGAKYCADEVLQTERCAGGQVCGWKAAANGWRCLPRAEDPCNGAPAAGHCRDGVIERCDRGQLFTEDCGAQDKLCAPKLEGDGLECRESPCGALDYRGRCNGQVAEWCKNDEPDTRDCGAEGLICDHVDNETGYYCLGRNECGSLSYQGRCDENVAVWCSGGQRKRKDCNDTNRTCSYINDEVGYICSDCGDIDYAGRCEGTVVHYCDREGNLKEKDCTDEGKTCGFVSDALGNWCTERAVPPPAPPPDDGAPEVDSDGDGIMDGRDLCSGTTPGANVWSHGDWLGCAGGQFRDRD